MIQSDLRWYTRCTNGCVCTSFCNFESETSFYYMKMGKEVASLMKDTGKCVLVNHSVKNKYLAFKVESNIVKSKSMA